MSVAARIVALHESGWTYGELAEAYGKTRCAIAGMIWRHKHPKQRSNGKGLGGSPKRGESSRRAKLTEDQVRTIRARWANGETSASISRDFRVDPSHIWMIAKGMRWAHVPVQFEVSL